VNFPTISIIIVTYNAASTLQNCLNSIYKQKYPNLKIIIIDGKSTDETVDIIKANSKNIFYWISEPDKGIYDAMNKSLAHIKGDWVYFLGADDFLFDDFSSLCFDLQNTKAIYYGSVLTKGLKRSGELKGYHQAKHGIFHQAMIYPSWIFNKYSYNLKYRIFADYALNMKCWGDVEIQFIFKDYIIANFNHTGTSGNYKDPEFEKDKSKLVYQNFGLLIWLRLLFRNLKKRSFEKADD
jgi:glycosyltransferase involved in cell wall biosynthesis